MTAAAVGGWSEGRSYCRCMIRARICESADDVAAPESCAYSGEEAQAQAENWVRPGSWVVAHDAYTHGEEVGLERGMCMS